MQKFLLMALAALSFVVAGCAPQYDTRGPGYSRSGPPPHAPAHGYRHKHETHDLVYDSRLGAYSVAGVTDYYFLDNRYYRYQDGWQYAADIDGRWQKAGQQHVPKKLYQQKAANKGKAKGQQKKTKARGESDL